MTPYVGLLVPALLLLLFPADRLLSSLVELRSFDHFHSLENSPRYRPWWWVPVLWLDPLRAFAGTVLLRIALVPVHDWDTTDKRAYFATVAVLGVAVVVQLLTRRDPEVMLAPLGFVAGIVAALAPWAVTLIGLTMALAAMFAFRRFLAFFGAGTVAVGLLGFGLGAVPMWLVPALAVLALPCAAGLITGRALELPVRNSSAARRVA